MKILGGSGSAFASIIGQLYSVGKSGSRRHEASGRGANIFTSVEFTRYPIGFRAALVSWSVRSVPSDESTRKGIGTANWIVRIYDCWTFEAKSNNVDTDCLTRETKIRLSERRCRTGLYENCLTFSVSLANPSCEQSGVDDKGTITLVCRMHECFIMICSLVSKMDGSLTFLRMGELGGEVTTVESETSLEHDAHESVRDIVDLLSREHAAQVLLRTDDLAGLSVQVLRWAP